MFDQCEPQYLTEAEAARALDVSLRTLQRWRASGMGPPYSRVGPRRLRYSHTDLALWLADQRHLPVTT